MNSFLINSTVVNIDYNIIFYSTHLFSNQTITISGENPETENILSQFETNENITSVSYKNKYEYTVTDLSECIVEPDTSFIYYKYEIPKNITTDIITNIHCNYDNIHLAFNSDTFIDCSVNNSTIPLSFLTDCPVYLYILLSDTGVLETNIDLIITYDVYFLNSELNELLSYKTLLNNEEMVFETGQFINLL